MQCCYQDQTFQDQDQKVQDQDQDQDHSFQDQDQDQDLASSSNKFNATTERYRDTNTIIPNLYPVT